MKKLFLILTIASSAYGADYDVVKGVDMSGRSNYTAALLNQLVDRATIATNKGLLIVTNGTPNLSRYTNFIWLDRSTDPPTAKVYYSAAGTWVTATIADGSVTTTKLADGAVGQTKLGADSVTSTNIISQSILSGDIAPLNVIESLVANSNITRVKIAFGAIDGPQITNGAITYAKLDPSIQFTNNFSANSVGRTNLQANSVDHTNIIINGIFTTNIGAGVIVATNIATGTITTNLLAYYPAAYTNMATNALPAPAGNVSFTHGLAGVPSAVRVVLMCNNASGDAGTGASLGDEIEITSCRPNGTSDPLVQVYCTATTVSIVRADGSGVWRVAKKSTGVLTAATAESNFVLKVRAWFQP